MAKEISRIAPTDADSFPKRSFLDELRSKWLATPAVILGGLALTASSQRMNLESARAAIPIIAVGENQAYHGTAQPLPHFGYDTNRIWVEDTNQALAEGRAVAETQAADTIRILTPYTVGGVEINNDLTRYCNALYATQANGLRLEDGLDGHFRDRRWGYFAINAHEMLQLHTELFNLMSHLSGGSCHDENGNPIKATEFNFDFNEPNYSGRYKEPHMGQKLADLLIYLAPLLRADAQKLGVKVNLTAAAVTLSQADNPQEFLNEFNQELQAKLPADEPLPFDGLALNDYAFGQFTADNLNKASQTLSLDNAVSLIRSDFGQDLPISISELGAFSGTPSIIENQYSVPVPETVKTFPGNQQGQFYESVIDRAACLKLVGVNIFHLEDDPLDALRTGTRYPDGSPKPSASIVSMALKKLHSGQVNC